jgi:hypothetical protein
VVRVEVGFGIRIKRLESGFDKAVGYLFKNM